MSVEAFERREELYRLRAKLEAAETARQAGQAMTVAESRKRLEEIYGASH